MVVAGMTDSPKISINPLTGEIVADDQAARVRHTMHLGNPANQKSGH